MLRSIFTLATLILITNIATADDGFNKNKMAKPVRIHKNITGSSKEEKWNSFWKNFINAVNTKDKKRIAELTSKDFYDGGGGTVHEWLEMEVFFSDKHFSAFKSALLKGAKKFKGLGDSYKATGKNNSGDLFFEYKNEQWVFGGVVGD